MKRGLRQLGVVVLLSAACTFSAQKRQIQNGEQALSEGHGEAALKYYEMATQGSDQALALDAARKAARLAQLDLKKYQKAIDFFRFIIVASDRDDERKTAQKNIAMIYFENLLNYDKAIIEYEKLLQLDFPPEEKYQFRLNIAKSQHQLGNLQQALAELEELSKSKMTPDQAYELEVFKANVLMSEKRQLDAAQLLEALIKKFPERAQKESLALTLSVCYEEADDFKRAIDTLDAMKKSGYAHPDFLDTRIARLRSRMKNMPGANGLKK